MNNQSTNSNKKTIGLGITKENSGIKPSISNPNLQKPPRQANLNISNQKAHFDGKMITPSIGAKHISINKTAGLVQNGGQFRKIRSGSRNTADDVQRMNSGLSSGGIGAVNDSLRERYKMIANRINNTTQ